MERDRLSAMQRVWVMLGSDGSRAHGPRLRMRILSPSHPSIPAHDNQVWPISAARDSSEKVHCSQCVLQHCALHPARGDILDGWTQAADVSERRASSSAAQRQASAAQRLDRKSAAEVQRWLLPQHVQTRSGTMDWISMTLWWATCRNQLHGREHH